jgi:hypothetical protein
MTLINNISIKINMSYEKNESETDKGKNIRDTDGTLTGKTVTKSGTQQNEESQQQGRQKQSAAQEQQSKQTSEYGEQDEQSAKQGQHGQEPSGKSDKEKKT